MPKIKTYNETEDWKYKAIDAYQKVENPEEWLPCPNCGLIPKIWEFDNGRSTACGCGKNKYDHFSIHAESIMSVVSRSKTGGDVSGYDKNELRKNWNHWVKTGEILFDPKEQLKKGRW